MDSGRLIFDCSSSSYSNSGRMLILGGSRNSIFQGARSMLSMEEGMNKRRPFFTSPEELLEEEYYDEHVAEKKRRLTPEQVHMLEWSFEVENKLEPERKSELAKKLGLQPRQVAVWFQNRRARCKTKQLERDYDRLKAAYESLLADHNSLLKDNDHLRSQVVTLSEKLHTNYEIAIEGPIGNSNVGMINTDPTRNVNKSDQLSTWSGGSAVVDVESQQLMGSCASESYYHGDFGVDVGPAIGFGCGGVRVEEEEDIGSDDGCNYLPDCGASMFGELS